MSDNNITPSGTYKTSDLLDYAAKHYPPGTTYRNISNSKREPQTTKAKFRHYVKADHITDGCGGAVHYDGKWAEVISYPEGFNPNNINSDSYILI